jgi:hypothetical protein
MRFARKRFVAAEDFIGNAEFVGKGTVGRALRKRTLLAENFQQASLAYELRERPLRP